MCGTLGRSDITAGNSDVAQFQAKMRFVVVKKRSYNVITAVQMGVLDENQGMAATHQTKT
jgi:hypothetical protein